MLVNEKNHYCQQDSQEKILKEFIDQNCIIREQRIKYYSYLYLHLQKPLFRFWVKLISSKIANYDSEYKHNSVVQKGSVELLHSRITRRHKGFELPCMAYSKNARALSRLLFSVKAKTFMNVTESYNQFYKWKIYTENLPIIPD